MLLLMYNLLWKCFEALLEEQGQAEPLHNTTGAPEGVWALAYLGRRSQGSRGRAAGRNIQLEPGFDIGAPAPHA